MTTVATFAGVQFDGTAVVVTLDVAGTGYYTLTASDGRGVTLGYYPKVETALALAKSYASQQYGALRI